MPWWIWVIITLFMLCMIACGTVFAIRNAFRIFENSSSFLEKVSSCFERLQDNNDSLANDTSPLFTRPIKDAARRYEHTRIKVNDRHNRIRETHKSIWQNWNTKSLRQEDIDNPIFKESKES